MNTTLDFNNTLCLREIHNIGSTTVVNICSDKVINVPWGSVDLFLIITAVALTIVIISFVGLMMWKLRTI